MSSRVSACRRCERARSRYAWRRRSSASVKNGRPWLPANGAMAMLLLDNFPPALEERVRVCVRLVRHEDAQHSLHMQLVNGAFA